MELMFLNSSGTLVVVQETEEFIKTRQFLFIRLLCVETVEHLQEYIPWRPQDGNLAFHYILILFFDDNVVGLNYFVFTE